MELKSKFLTRNKNLIVFVFFAAFWFTLILSTGTIKSGYHFTDDHLIITINKQLNDSGLVNTCKSILGTDFKIRLRTFYYLHRIIETKLLGTKLVFWSVYNAILAIFTSFFLYLFIERQEYKTFHAILFSFLTLMGAQASIWWRLGPAETIGFFLLSASLFFLSNSIFKRKKYQLIISFIFLFLSSLVKESFAFFIPAYSLILLWLEYQQKSNKTILNIVKDNGMSIIFLGTVFIAEVYIIIFVIGTNKIGYAGIDNSFNLFKFFKFIYTYLSHDTYIYLMVFGLFLLLQNIKEPILGNVDFKRLLPYSFNLGILLLIILPQFLLYNKSGIYDRYLLPFNLGFSIFSLFLLNEIYKSGVISAFSKKSYVLSIIFIICFFLKDGALQEAKNFTRQGVATNKFLSIIIDNTNQNDSILVVLNSYENYEWGHSIKLWLELNANRRNVMFLPIDIVSADKFSAALENGFSQKFSNVIVKEENNNFQCIAIMPFDNNKEIKRKLDNNPLYQRNDCDESAYFTVYTRNKK